MSHHLPLNMKELGIQVPLKIESILVRTSRSRYGIIMKVNSHPQRGGLDPLARPTRWPNEWCIGGRDSFIFIKYMQIIEHRTNNKHSMVDFFVQQGILGFVKQKQIHEELDRVIPSYTHRGADSLVFETLGHLWNYISKQKQRDVICIIWHEAKNSC